jgi:hypothetical protein
MTSPLAHIEKNIPFYFPESWETYLANQFIPNSPIVGCRNDSYNNTSAHYPTILSTASD